MFDDPARDAWQKPHEVIRALHLGPDAVVADIGAGTGYFAMRLANMLPEGRVYAVDIETDMVEHLISRAKREQRANVIAVKGTAADPRLPEPVDLILFVNVYHHIDARTDYFRRLQKLLRPQGRVAIVDFLLDAPEGPPKAARIAKEQVIAELRAAGLALMSDQGFLPRQYYLVFAPSS